MTGLLFSYFAGMLPLASAMDKSGAGKMIADGVVGIIGDNPSPMLIVVAMFILSCGLTQFYVKYSCCSIY